MPQPPALPAPADDLKRRVLLAILALAWVASGAAWLRMESIGQSSPLLRLVFALNLVFHPAAFAAVRWRLLPLRVVDMACLVFAAIVCAGCMVARLYLPEYGAAIDLQPLYLWIPVIHVFVFTLMGHRASLRLSLAIYAAFVAISLPYLFGPGERPHLNFTVQLHAVSAVLIAALHFFSSWQYRYQLAQLTLDELARRANTDELTGLANRRRTAEAIRAELNRFARYGHPFSVILMDIDHFKAVNDRLGHAAGDRALVALAARTGEVLRDVDMLGRWGGEEFVVILPETRFEETLYKATALCAHVAARPMVDALVLTISCGVASVRPADTPETLLQRADEALYAAKRLGRNRAEGLADPQPEAVRDPA